MCFRTMKINLLLFKVIEIKFLTFLATVAERHSSSSKMTKTLTVSCKYHHLIETFNVHTFSIVN